MIFPPSCIFSKAFNAYILPSITDPEESSVYVEAWEGPVDVQEEHREAVILLLSCPSPVA